MRCCASVLLVLLLGWSSCTCSGVSTPLRVTAISPVEGPLEGGTPVSINGSGFSYGASVYFGDKQATDVVWIDHTTLAARTPPGVGTVPITVVNPDLETATLDDAFLFHSDGCVIASTSPGFNEEGVGVVGPYRVTWSDPIAPESLTGKIVLRELGVGSVPFALAMEGTQTAVITPEKSLHFWGAYGIEIAEGVMNVAGDACAAGAVAFSTVVPEVVARPQRPASIRGLAVIGNHAIAASPGYRGLQIYDVADPLNPTIVNEVLTEYDPLALVAAGDRLYAPAGYRGVLIFDVVDPANPQFIWRAGTPGYASDVAPFSRDGRDYLAVADAAEGVRLLDVTDPWGPIDLGAIDPSGSRTADIRAVAVAGDLLAIADGARGFELVSLTDLGNPTIVGAWPTQYPTLDVLLDGSVLYVARGYYGVASYDIADPSTPVLLVVAYGPDGQCTFTCVDYLNTLARVGDQLFVAADRTGAVRFQLDGIGGLTFDAALPVPGHGTVAVPSGEHLLVGAEEGLLVFERSAPDGSTPVWFDETGHGLARGVAVTDSHIYVAASTRGLQTFAPGNAVPVLVDRDDSPGALSADIAAFSVEVGAGVVVLGDGRAGLTVYDATNPDDPVQGGTIEAGDRIGGLAMRGTIAYACDDNAGLLVADVEDFENPFALMRLSFADIGADQCLDLAIRGDVLYVASGTRLIVIDITNPAAPTWAGVFPLPTGDSVVAIAVLGDHLLASTHVYDFEGTFGVARRLQVFSLDDPLVPVRVYVGPDLGATGDIVVARDIAFIAALDQGVLVFDVSDPTQPIFEGTIPTPGNAVALRFRRDTLYVAQGAGGLQAIHTGLLPAP